MGLLDDAIREHLELKRRRGADASEIERQESEALGPVRREAAPAAEDGPHPDEPAGLEDPGAAYAEDVHPAEADVDRPHLADAPTTHEHAYAETEAESATPPHGDPYQSTREFSSEELEAALGSGRRESARDRPGDDVGAVSASAAAEGEEPAEGADELEETPDFLQETPEHDRLWFEQKPPKDFDF